MFDHPLGQLLAIEEHNAFAFNTVHEIDRVTRVIRSGDHDTFLGADHFHAANERLDRRAAVYQSGIFEMRFSPADTVAEDLGLAARYEISPAITQLFQVVSRSVLLRLEGLG